MRCEDYSRTGLNAIFICRIGILPREAVYLLTCPLHLHRAILVGQSLDRPLYLRLSIRKVTLRFFPKSFACNRGNICHLKACSVFPSGVT